MTKNSKRNLALVLLTCAALATTVLVVNQMGRYASEDLTTPKVQNTAPGSKAAVECVRLSLDGKEAIESMYNREETEIENFIRQGYCGGAIGKLIVAQYDFNNVIACVISKEIKSGGDRYKCNQALAQKMKEQNTRIQVWASRCGTTLNKEEPCE